MDDFQSELISSLEEMKKQKEEDDKLQLIKEQFASMEQRYHTWMNYYSLFNGALLVAYCTILVSTGNVVEKVVCDEKTCYDLNCTYWGFLVLIACLGIVASYCWYLSMIGHNKWLGNWRNKLQKKKRDIMKKISGEKLKFIECKGKKVLPGFYSTATITKHFILSVLTGWNIIFFYAIFKSLECKICLCSIVLVMVLAIILTSFLYYISRQCRFYLWFGSDLTGFEIESEEETDDSNQK